MSKYRSQAADVELAQLERIALHPEASAGVAASGANLAAIVRAAEIELASRLVESTHRTEVLPRISRSTVQRKGYLHRCTGRDECATECTCAQSYERLEGAPVGTIETLASANRERVAAANERAWSAWNARAESGLASTRAQRRNARRKAQRSTK